MSKCCVSIHYIPGSVLDAGDMAVHRIEMSDLMKLSFKRERQEINMTNLFLKNYNTTL